MDTCTTSPSLSELNAAALERFVYTPVSRPMIQYLARAAANVIQCDPTMMPPTTTESSNPQQLPTPPRSPSPRAVRGEDSDLPSLEEFITQLVISSNVQVPTLMSTLVYLRRLKSRLQPMAKGLRCTTHRIFLASLILAAKYLNDSSPKNKHWATYSVISNDAYTFGFSRTEVNLMEKQLLFLLDWDLRITEEDLYRSLDTFLAPIRGDIMARHARRQQRRWEEQQRRKEEADAWLAAVSEPNYPTPPSSRGSSRSRQASPASDISPGLSYSSSHSSSSSYASSLSSRATTPLSEVAADPYVYSADAAAAASQLYGSPTDLPVLEAPSTLVAKRAMETSGKQANLLPYEISPEELRELQEGRVKRMRGVLGRVFGTTAATR